MDSTPSSPKRARVSPCAGSMDLLMEQLLSLSDTSVALSLERVVDSAASDSDRDRLIDAAVRVGSSILESAGRSARKRSARHNSKSWPLPSDLTVKVFSMLDTQSLCRVAATCSAFNKCAVDPLCYTNIDLTTTVPNVNNTVVSTMIQRAGKNLQSLKLGILPNLASTSEHSRSMSYSSRSSMDGAGLLWNEKRPRQGRESSFLTRSCLLALSLDSGVAGALLKRLHLYNIYKMDSTALCTAIAACQSLLDLEIIGLHVELKRTLVAVSTNCHSIERLIIESSDAGRDNSLSSATCVDLVNGCPRINSLGLRGFKVHDHKARSLVKGLCNLKVVDFCTSYSITGTFLRNLGSGTYAQGLEVMILRDCFHLKEVEVAQFLSAVVGGDCKFLRYLDISNKDGLSGEEDWHSRRYDPSCIPVSQLLEERPDICLLANFPPDGSSMDIEHPPSDSETSNSTSLVQSNLEFSSYYSSSFDSSNSSDQGSGNEDFHDVNFAFNDGDNFDEMDFQFPYL
ncbi:F-box protein-like isoform X1 [Iris pallida]|uniref:F-box protein-like isoform X1 n=1 Tax=Iris pallida TaxID=29817 RepID=A0AAX6GVC8_IRIPA|nr:F-box protein-like isoform X1 [Iris pallida]